MGKKGITLIELIFTIILIAILAIAVIPRYIELRLENQKASDEKIINSIKDGITAAHTTWLITKGDTALVYLGIKFTAEGYPEKLDNALGNKRTKLSGALKDPLFTYVLEEGLTVGCGKNDDTSYNIGFNEYIYNNRTGEFIKK